MSISSVSRSPVSFPSSSTQGSAPVAPQAQQIPGLEALSAPQSNPLKSLLQTDSFEAGGAQGNLAALTKGIEQITQLLNKAVELLGGASAGGAAGAGGASPVGGGVPELGGDVPELGNAAPAGAAPAAPEGAAPAGAAPAGAAPTAPAGASKNASKTGNTMDFTNDGTKPMEIKFTPNAGGQEIEPLTLQPGESVTKQFPDGWSGNFRSTAGDGAAATLGEVAFNGGGNQTYYDVSYIEGNNASMTIAPESGGRVSGTLDNLAAGAPDSIKAKTADGTAYGVKKTTTSDVQDAAVVDYYRQHVGADQGYVIPKDDLSTLGTGDTHLSVHLKDVF
ncbi:hypothetical protein POL68_00505 [Stigmatella sp. ncwal1]|uniref:Uncharacterized protein n=1 Tax=Stigmatella ashevillensis TaxID=2995309 RepID=A0ABT5CZV1_9BACT|nr:hypothetical protein [Stigmatella ashevillena]MDC0706943.1 hypothetical protein [Stigmatella ashevillena]